MSTIRRIYLYAVSLVSLETILWSLIHLVRRGLSPGGEGDYAAELALVIVAGPVFGIHWWIAQRRRSAERQTWLRPVYLYAGLLATLIPAVQNAVLLAADLLGRLPGWETTYLFGDPSWEQPARLAAILINSLGAGYLYLVLRSDWEAEALSRAYITLRRIYLHVWLLYGLGLGVFGLMSLLQFGLRLWHGGWTGARTDLADGLALSLVGIPLWALVDTHLRRASPQAGEKDAWVRLLAFYLLALVSAGVVLANTGQTLASLGRAFLRRPTPAEWLSVNRELLAAIPVFGAVWWYAHRNLMVTIAARSGVLRIPGTAAETTQNRLQSAQASLRQQGLQRAYQYPLAGFGLIALFSSLYILAGIGLELTLAESIERLRWQTRLMDGLAMFLVGAPVWGILWVRLQRQARREDDSGTRTRSSVVRRAYLYLAMFIGVLGAMFGAGRALFPLLQALLGNPPPNLWLTSLLSWRTFLLYFLLFGLHVLILRQDSGLRFDELGQRHARFSVLVISPGENGFGRQILAALAGAAPEMPAAVHLASSGAPDETLSAAQAVILPASLLAQAPEAIRVWLRSFEGERIVVPVETEGWNWVGTAGEAEKLARRAAQQARLLAENQTGLQDRTVSWLDAL